MSLFLSFSSIDKMRKIKFTKMVASGNDFVVVDKEKLSAIRYPLPAIARQVCARKFGIGADGLLILEKSKIADFNLRIFNADGSEAEMCGNGARCAALYSGKKNINIRTIAGIIEAKVAGGNIKIKLTNPKAIRLDVPLKINGRGLSVNFINTGVPHAVVFVAGVDKINVRDIGSQIRYHKEFLPAGTNVDFVEILSGDSLNVRTYERGVEDETLACGTGSVAAGLIFALKSGVSDEISIHTKGDEVLKVYFRRDLNKFLDVWLEGKARIAYKGEYYV
jgi:diaminopimelate epimerase